VCVCVGVGGGGVKGARRGTQKAQTHTAARWDKQVVACMDFALVAVGGLQSEAYHLTFCALVSIREGSDPASEGR
jgi:hypothetical protein